MTIRLRALLARTLLAFALAFAQYGAFAHALTHVGEAQTHEHDSNAAQHHGCEICHAFASADGPTPASAAPVLRLPHAVAVLHASGATHGALDPALTRFLSRAPPFPIA